MRYAARHLLSIFCALLFIYAAAEEEARATIELEVEIPNRIVMYFVERGSVESRDGSRAADTSTLFAAASNGSSTTTVFDLSCATLGVLPSGCAGLYGGALLDTQRRPYPPVKHDAAGNITGAGDFPQFFTADSKTLRVFTPLPDWQVQVDMVGADALLGAEHFSVYSSTNGWRCLGYHPDWQQADAPESCPTSTDAARLSVPVVTVANGPGGWYDVTMGLKLRLDGSEAAGNFDRVLRYTLVDF